MPDRVIGAPRRYDTSLERAGYALGVGSGVGGLIAALLAALGGQHDPLGLLGAWLLGTAMTAVAVVAVAGPLWLVLHVAGMRRIGHAAALGAGVALAIFLGAQTYGFGLLAMPAMDNAALLYRWLSAAANSVVLALIAAGIGALMWRIAYRPAD